MSVILRVDRPSTYQLAQHLTLEAEVGTCSRISDMVKILVIL